jgi:hypothetical protein
MEGSLKLRRLGLSREPAPGALSIGGRHEIINSPFTTCARFE